jgi:hypothetical protein
LTPDARITNQEAFSLPLLYQLLAAPYASSKIQALALNSSFAKHRAYTSGQDQLEYLEALLVHLFESNFCRLAN